MNLNLNAYLYFETLAREGNVTAAAAKLYITQQALSQQIRRLENYYGVELFERPKMKLTYAGERLLAHCRKLTLWSRQVEDELKDISDEEAGEIHIGVTAKRGLNTIPAVFPAFHEEYPKIEVHLHEGNSSEILRDLEEETTDMAIVVSEIDSPEAESMVLTEERTFLFLSDRALRRWCGGDREYLISHRTEMLSISWFRNCPFLLNSPGTRLRKKCDAAFRAADITPQVVLTSGNTMNLAAVAGQGTGATFLSSSTNPEYLHHMHRFLIEGISDPEHLKISWLRTHYLSAPAKRFIALAKELLPQNTALPEPGAGLF